MSYKDKYVKYKSKYLSLRSDILRGGTQSNPPSLGRVSSTPQFTRRSSDNT